MCYVCVYMCIWGIVHQVELMKDILHAPELLGIECFSIIENAIFCYYRVCFSYLLCYWYDLCSQGLSSSEGESCIAAAISPPRRALHPGLDISIHNALQYCGEILIFKRVLWKRLAHNSNFEVLSISVYVIMLFIIAFVLINFFFQIKCIIYVSN